MCPAATRAEINKSANVITQDDIEHSLEWEHYYAGLSNEAILDEAIWHDSAIYWETSPVLSFYCMECGTLHKGRILYEHKGNVLFFRSFSRINPLKSSLYQFWHDMAEINSSNNDLLICSSCISK